MNAIRAFALRLLAAALKGKKVAILVENGFEQVELTEPRKALQEAGAEAHVVSPSTVPSRAGITPIGAMRSR